MFNTKLQNYYISGFNIEEFHIIRKEVFSSDIYHFNIKKKKPYILDLGSHIGITIMYFKSLYPDAEIVGYEPNPKLFEKLKENIEVNNLKDVSIHELAVSNSSGGMKLHIDSTDLQWYSTGGVIVGGWSGKQLTKVIDVKTVPLSSIIDKRVDILKMDIEGMELNALSEAKDKLKLIDNIAIEYHPSSKKLLSALITLLSRFFKIEILFEGKAVKKYAFNQLLTIRGTRLN